MFLQPPFMQPPAWENQGCLPLSLNTHLRLWGKNKGPAGADQGQSNPSSLLIECCAKCLWNLWQRTAPWSAINFVFSCKFLLVWGQRGRRKGIYPSCAPYFPSKLRIWIIDFTGFDYCYAYLKPSRENFIFLSHQISTSQFGSKLLDSNSLVYC